MPTNRKLVFVNGEIYHVYNRGVEKRPTFTDKRELARAIQAMKFYQFANLYLRLSKFLLLSDERKNEFLNNLNPTNKQVEIIAHCLMPNHFHFLLKQIKEGGISNFISNFCNSYTKYFNTKNNRIGPLFQGLFKAVHVDSDEQLIHLSRYIHLNPVSSFLIKPENLPAYQWSSYPNYLNISKENTTDNKEQILNHFKTIKDYEQFVLDHVDYAKKLELIKHLALE